jgi:hypothetical protein
MHRALKNQTMISNIISLNILCDRPSAQAKLIIVYWLAHFQAGPTFSTSMIILFCSGTCLASAGRLPVSLDKN